MFTFDFMQVTNRIKIILLSNFFVNEIKLKRKPHIYNLNKIIYNNRRMWF